MRLSEAAALEPLDIARDAAFESLGTVIHRLPAMLVFVEEAKYRRDLEANPAIAAVITTPELADAVPPGLGLALTPDPRGAFYRLHNRLAAETAFYGEDTPTVIDPTAQIHPAAVIPPVNVRIGARVVIEPNATLLGRVEIGDDSVIRAGCVIGGQGFEFKRLAGRIVPVAHAGGVRLGQRVETQSNSCIDRSVFGGWTELGDDTKLDNLVHVAHNVTVGRRTLIAAAAMIAGSVTIGDDVWIGPSAVISNGLEIGDGATVTIGSTVVRDVPAGARVTGHWAIPHEQFVADFKRRLRATGD